MIKPWVRKAISEPNVMISSVKNPDNRCEHKEVKWISGISTWAVRCNYFIIVTNSALQQVKHTLRVYQLNPA